MPAAADAVHISRPETELEYTISFAEVSVLSMKAALSRRVGEVLEILTGQAYEAPVEESSQRDYHSMERGRDLPPDSPFVDRSTTRSAGDECDVRISADVAKWNPRETANCTFSASLIGPDGNGVRISAGAQQTDSVSTARVSFLGDVGAKSAILLARIRDIFEEA